MGNILSILMALMLGLIVPNSSAETVDIQIQDPWIQAAPPGATVLAAYMEIKNEGEKPRMLTSVTSPAFGQVGIHRSVMHGNMAHMEHLKELAIPAHASVTMKPGGLHLMLMDAKKPLKVGDQVPMTLIFRDGKKAALTATVRSSQANGTEDHQHMDHSQHHNHKP